MNTEIRIAIIGCGAISQQWHLPILVGHEHFNVVAGVDYSTQIQKDIELAYNIPTIIKDYQQLDLTTIDAVVIATPVSLHFPIAQHFLSHGIHVLAEKPLAFNYEQSSQLVELAEKNNCVLAVGLYRRLFSSLALLKDHIQQAEFGAVKGFEFNWGDFYSWSATSLGNMIKSQAGGGVLMDLGPHALDWLTYLFGSNISLLNYVDDAKGGIEADCSLHLQFDLSDTNVEGHLNLSRVRQLGGELVVEFEKAKIVLGVGERYDLTIYPKQSVLSEPVKYNARYKHQKDENWFEAFKKEFDDFSESIKGLSDNKLSGASVLPAMKIIDQCYETKTAVECTWENISTHFSLDNLPYSKILITGASGFIGGRITEVLSKNNNLEIRALVNNPNNASRLSRLNADMMQVDLTNPEQVAAAVSSCDAVIHCAIGTAFGENDVIRAVTVDGTQNLLTACAQHNVKRFVHLSSLAVMDLSANNTLNEMSPLNESSDIYSSTKLAAEQAVKNAATQGLNCLILRPTNVYGPNSQLFKVGAGKQLLNGGLSMSNETANAPINAVYIDNLVEAVLCCLKVKGNQAQGQHYLVNDSDSGIYKSFYQAFADRFNNQVLVTTPPKSMQETSDSIFLEFKGVFKSKELKKLLKKVYDAQKLGKLPRYIIKSFPSLENIFKNTKGEVYTGKNNGASFPYIESSTLQTVNAAKINTELEFKQIVPTDKAIELTGDWVQFAYNLKKQVKK